MANITAPGAGAAVHRDRPRATAEVDLVDQVAALKSLLGPKLMSLTMGVDPVTVDRWMVGQTHPRLDDEKRTRAVPGLRVAQGSGGQSHDPGLVMGMNPQLDDRSPAEVIAEGDLRAVLAAARAFLAGG